eukprot:IDg21649t1
MQHRRGNISECQGADEHSAWIRENTAVMKKIAQISVTLDSVSNDEIMLACSYNCIPTLTSSGKETLDDVESAREKRLQLKHDKAQSDVRTPVKIEKNTKAKNAVEWKNKRGPNP